MPFVANDGQADEHVKYYANTFAGSVFVTKDGEIVYSLPSGRDVPAGASQESGRGLKRGAEGQGRKVGWHGQAPLVRAESAFVANGYSPFFRVDNASCPPDRIFVKSLIAAYLPELLVGTRCPCPPLAHLSGSQKGTDKQSLSMPPNSNTNVLPANDQANIKPALAINADPKQSPEWHTKNPLPGGDSGVGKPLPETCPRLRSGNQNVSPTLIRDPQPPTKCVALKEHLVGGKIGEIRGESPSATTVSYFKGNDPSQWKTNLATAELVNLGEVYEGIDLRLKAYGNNVEKLFTVKPGANPGQINIRLDTIQPPYPPFLRGTPIIPP